MKEMTLKDIQEESLRILKTVHGFCVENGIDFAKYFNFIMQASGITYATSLRAGNVLYLPSTTASKSDVILSGCQPNSFGSSPYFSSLLLAGSKISSSEPVTVIPF